MQKHFLNIYTHIILLGLGLSIGSTAQAQMGIGEHFLPRLYSSTFTNPAFQQDSRFQLLLGSGGLFALHEGFNLGDILTATGGNTYELDMDGAINALDANNLLAISGSVTGPGAVLRIGTKGQIGLSTAVRTQNHILYPKDALGLLWRGNGAYIGEDVQVGPAMDFTTFGEVGLSFSWEIIKQIKVGARVKYLSGIQHISTEESNLTFRTDTTIYGLSFTSDYRIRTSGPAAIDPTDIQNFDPGNVAPSSLSFGGNSGFAFDLGLEVRPMENLRIGASIQDVGSINWDQNARNFHSQGTFAYGAVDPLKGQDSLGEGGIVQRLLNVVPEGLLDSVIGSLGFAEEQKNFSAPLRRKFNVSAFWEPIPVIGVGAMYQNMTIGDRSYQLTSLFASVKVGRALTLGLSYTGGMKANMVGFHTRMNAGPLQVYISADNILGVVSPLNANSGHIRIGTALTFGNPKGKSGA